MDLFLDTEFTGLRKDASLISIGVISENGKSFYAEFSDYDKEKCDTWIVENILKHTIMNGCTELSKDLENDQNVKVVIGSKDDIKHEFEMWLKQFDSVQFVSDVCHYDMVLLIDVFGTAFDLPINVSPVCHDINQDIAKYYGISEKEAFDKYRESIIEDFSKGNKHNSLYDAKIIKMIYNKIRR